MTNERITPHAVVRPLQRVVVSAAGTRAVAAFADVVRAQFWMAKLAGTQRALSVAEPAPAASRHRVAREFEARAR